MNDINHAVSATNEGSFFCEKPRIFERSSKFWLESCLPSINCVCAGCGFFSGPPRALFTVTAVASDSLPELLEFPGIETISSDRSKALDRLSRQQTDLVVEVVGDSVRYWVNGNSASGAILELLLKYTESRSLERGETDGEAIRYVDWVVPGILGMNMMYSALWGVGYVVVRYRQSGYLRRLRATPLTKFEFLSAQVLSRLLVTLTASTIVFVGTNLILDYKMVGSLGLLIFNRFGGWLGNDYLGTCDCMSN